MENFGPIAMMLFICCGWPGIIGFLGYAYGRGAIRSPIAFQRRRQAVHIDDDY